MSSDASNIDKLSDRITQLVPDFVQEEAPVFEQFLKAYYEFLEKLKSWYYSLKET